MGKTKNLLADTRYWADEMEEARLVDVDYQYEQEIKKQWIEKLKSKFKVKTNDK